MRKKEREKKRGELGKNTESRISPYKKGHQGKRRKNMKWYRII